MEPTPPRNPLTLAGTVAAVALVVALFVLLGREVVASARGNGLATALAAGERPVAPDFHLPQLDGGTLALSELRGRPVVVNFWASWCVPCKTEAPRLQAAAERHPELVVVGVNAQDLEGDARRFVARHGIRYPNVHDGGGGVLRDYGVTGFPETWFVDRNGRLTFRRVEGEISRRTLEQAASALGVR